MTEKAKVKVLVPGCVKVSIPDHYCIRPDSRVAFITRERDKDKEGIKAYQSFYLDGDRMKGHARGSYTELKQKAIEFVETDSAEVPVEQK